MALITLVNSSSENKSLNNPNNRIHLIKPTLRWVEEVVMFGRQNIHNLLLNNGKSLTTLIILITLDV